MVPFKVIFHVYIQCVLKVLILLKLKIDFSKAFDTVPHNKLLHKLEVYGIRGILYQWIKSFLCYRKMRVVVEGHSSSDVQSFDITEVKDTGL
jgi:D-alanyl-lipoteichoic acid acyltransferase DltB (MBOAT superfamily)